ncbi:rho guanine nucleotide exchange factor 11 isoform X3 [Bradysia coprophila]|uniref:rho guanine nucleotide exchange factor 11 isoform X3 n=1 Tax=Bradysia coprophila TaxID=38358 RepID=UPI00187D8B34|nr:rho guanine nucleotide exchange factor 11 isoform X3 [Bradysia coprophila]
MDNTSPLGPSERHSHGGSQVNGSGIRRPTTLMTQNDRKLVSPPQNLVLTIHKDAGGYGMKVSGDNPVYVESVKAGGASQKAGLHEGDMILKVNGTNVRYSTHTNVVQLIKSSATVELTVQRNYKMQQRPSSISVGPSTPLAQRGGITGPKPVDSATSHDVKMTKIQTLHLYLDKEKKNLENLKSTNANRQDILRAEHTIRTLQEQLQLLCVEALGLTPQQMSKLNSSQHRRVVSSPEHYHQREPSDPIDDRRLTTSGSWDIVERDNETTPADGTPPPRYSPTPNPLDDSMTDSLFESSYPDLNRPSNVIHQRQIISMEDDEMTEEQDSINEDHGPFRSLHQLLEQENLAYLSVFLNFVLSNSNPSPLLFYLITGLYKDGTMKDMRKWAYEIHSTFLVPRAPLLWCGVDESESLARDVDNVLQNEHQKIEILRSIFRKSRQRAKEHINQQIEEFKIKRIAGLGTLYGPSDHQLMESKGDKVKEQKVFEETLVPKLQQLVDELEKESPNECPKKSALSSALSTVLHRIFVTRSNPGGPIDRVHHFVSREKSFKSRLMGKNRKAMVRGHHLVLRQYYEVAHCNHCQNIIWGVSPQGYHCTDCELNIHRACSKVLEENCPGPAPSKQKGQHTDKMTKFIDKIRPTHIFNERPRRQDEDGVNEELATSDRPTSTSVVRQPSDRRPDISNSSTAQSSVDFTHAHSVDTDSNAPDAEPAHRDSSKSKSAPVSVNRSESYKERLSHRRNRNNRRKTSDPSLSKTNDEQQVDLGISNVNFASSSSSLSSSPSTSLEAVAPTAGQGTIPAPRQWVDSDDEAGDNIADWSSNVAADILQTLSDGEKKRQEIINEIYQTERNHVRTLRLLEGIFMRPLQESAALNAEHLNLLFPPALLILKDHHSSFEQQLKQRRIEHGSLVGDIGDLLLTMFDGRSGEELKEHAAHFCARQQIALEALKEKRRKDENLQRLLTKAESHKACRRLQLKDLLPTALQRLTKYPLLFESLYKITVRVSPDNDAEAIAVRKALDSSKRILDHVNQAVRHAEDAHKLQTIQKKLDKANYEKEASSEFKNVDLTQHKLLHDGPLIMKKNPSVQLHGLLFENMMVLLQKQDDKYILKFHNNPGAGAAEGKSIEGRFNPISKINLILVRRSAVDTNAFFLINTSVTQMLELTAPSSSECKTWFKHISDAAEAYKSRTKGNHDISEDPIPATLSNSPTKESLEGTPEKELSPAITHNDPSNVSNIESQKNISNDANEQNNNSDVKDVNDEKQIGRDTVEDDEEEVKVRHRKYSSGTRILTQQQSLIDPSEVQISVSPVLTAEPVLTPQEQLRRLDETIRFKLAEKQKVICDMYRVPNEHFSEIADIAGQPEAPKEPSDIVLAAFAQVQSLTETLNDHMKVSCRQELLAISKRVCDDCHTSGVHQTRHSHKNSLVQVQVATKATTTTTPVETPQAPTLPANARNGAAAIERMDPLQDDDGYCEIDELRLPTTINNVPQITQSTANTTTPELKRQSTISADSIPEETEHEINAELLASSVLCDSELGDVTEVNDTYDGTECDEHALDTMGDIRMQLLNSCMESISGGNQMNPVNSLAPAVPCHLLTQFVATLNSQLSLLLPKLNERDIEREKLRKENQHLRELLNSMHERERVSSERETPERASDIRKSSSQESTN